MCFIAFFVEMYVLMLYKRRSTVGKKTFVLPKEQQQRKLRLEKTEIKISKSLFFGLFFSGGLLPLLAMCGGLLRLFTIPGSGAHLGTPSRSRTE